MKMKTDEFVAHARLDAEVLEAWIEAGWLLPRQDGAKRNFFDVDLARAHLIHDLERLGVNDEGIPVILDLVDQLHGLRRTLRDLLSTIHAQPEALRRWIVADLRVALLDRTDAAAQEGPETARRIADNDATKAAQAASYRFTALMAELKRQYNEKASELRASYVAEIERIGE
jgi:chaperone modulatory protein CbpM